MKLPLARHRRGFTLVEMLVVMVIIAILVGLLIPTIGMALRAAKNGAMSTELSQLVQAVEAYAKDHNNDYPPDFSNQQAVIAHFRRAFPRSNFNAAAWLTSNPTLDPAEALVFFLSQTRNNPRNPIAGPGEVKIYYDFDQTRLVDLDSDGFQEFVPRYGQGAPYVYFDGRVINIPSPSGGTSPTCMYAFSVYPSPFGSSTPIPAVTKATTAIPASTGTNAVRPYRSNQLAPPGPPNGSEVKTWPNDRGTTDLNNTQWISPGRFQIICAGMDGNFGDDNLNGTTLAFKQFPAPNYYASAPRELDDDNLSSFSEGRTFGDSVP